MEYAILNMLDIAFLEGRTVEWSTISGAPVGLRNHPAVVDTCGVQALLEEAIKSNTTVAWHTISARLPADRRQTFRNHPALED